jgi:small subunit ribosomal protein S20
VKSLRSTIKAGVKATAAAAAPKLASIVDKAAKTGRIHKNKANRLKSRAAKAIAKIAA